MLFKKRVGPLLRLKKKSFEGDDFRFCFCAHSKLLHRSIRTTRCREPLTSLCRFRRSVSPLRHVAESEQPVTGSKHMTLTYEGNLRDELRAPFNLSFTEFFIFYAPRKLTNIIRRDIQIKTLRWVQAHWNASCIQRYLYKMARYS